MKKLNEFNFERKVIEMVNDFTGIEDSCSICNINMDGQMVQVKITLIAEGEIDFNEFKGIPTIELE